MNPVDNFAPDSHDDPAVESRNDPAAERLAEGFAQHAERWARRLREKMVEGGEVGGRGGALLRARPLEDDEASIQVLRHCAYAVSLATSNGHVCLTLEDLALTPSPAGGGQGWGQVKDLRSSLLSTSLVGTPETQGALPLILDADGRLYLHRYFDYERRLARRLMQAAAAPPRSVDPAARDLLQTLFPPAADGEVDWQKIAAALALRNGLTVISGGPGTGKTTTVVNLLACLITQDPHSRIALAAPTGKAAARMTEAIRQRAEHLPEALRERLPSGSSTIHRLLGANPGLGKFTHHAGNPLPIDALIVDEASMLDLALATRLLEAVPPSARIILLGDKDQLAAVESGAVFAELCADPTLSDSCKRDLAALCVLAPERIATPAPVQPSALRDAAVWLTRNYRFAAGSDIGRLADCINQGRAQEAMAWLELGDDPSVQWLQPGKDASERMLAPVLAGYEPYLDAVRRDPTDVDGITRAFGDFRTLCAVRQGPSGVTAANDQLSRHARQALWASPLDGRSPWYAGRPVMVLRNDYVHKLFNGDIGIALPDASGELAVFFPDGEQGYRAVPTVRMPEHETAFAMTVHKAQGSEFDAVLVVLPLQGSRVVTRELLYTAVTRAKTRVSIFSNPEVLRAAIESQSERRSGLLARMRCLLV
jgi:exodeoxyribonuclease V alpha subunit